MSLIGPCCLYAMTELADLTGAKTSPPPLSSGFCETDDWFWLGLDDSGHSVLKSTSSTAKLNQLRRDGFLS